MNNLKKGRQKPKPYIEATIRTLVPEYTKLCALEKAPYVTFSRPEIRTLRLPGHTALSGYYGMTWKHAFVIWINPNHMVVEEARNTLAHEFIHLRFPYLSHGDKFERKVKELLAGAQFKPYRKLQV